MSDEESEKPALWLDCLPVDLQIRIATYVSDGKSGLDALNLAKASPCQPHAVCTALDHTLEHAFAGHKDGLVEDWTQVFVDVRILQLHEHPPNFSLLHSPFLKLVVVEDEPIQLQALSRSGVSFDRLELSLRYGTPANVICRYLRFIKFRKLDLYVHETNFWLEVDTDDLLSACEGVKAVYLHDHYLITNGVPPFLNGLTTLHELTIDLRGSGCLQDLESVMMRIKRMRVSVWDSQLPELIELAAKTQTELRRIRIYSLGGIDEDALHALREDIREIQKLEKLRIVLTAGSELLFPRLPNLSNVDIRWDRGPDSFNDSDPYYRPPEGAILNIVERHSSLKSLRLYEVRVRDEEVEAIIERLGTRLTRFGLSLDGQDVPPHQRLLTVLRSLSRHCNNLVELDLDYFADFDECKNVQERDRFTNNQKREALFYLNRLQRRNVNLNLEDVEDAIIDFLEQDKGLDMEESEKETAEELQRVLALRRCRRTLNEVGGDASHFVKMGQLLEIGCDGLKQDLDAAAQAYRKAVRMGNREAILQLWDITDQKASDSSEPVPGGALALILELEEIEKDAIPCFADFFLHRTRRSHPPNYRGLARILRFAVSNGHIQCGKQLARLVEDGYEEIPPDPESAIQLYRSVVEHCGDTDALFSWAECVYEGYGNQDPDPASAMCILQSGAWKNCAECINFVGVIVQEGFGDVEPNPDAALDYYQWAMGKGSAAAKVNLAMLYAKGDERYPPDPESASELFSMSMGINTLTALTASKHLLDKLLSNSGNPDCDCEDCKLQNTVFRRKSAPLPYLSTYGYENHPVNQEEAIRLYNDTKDSTLSVLWQGRVQSRFAEKKVSVIRVPDIGSHRLVLFKLPRVSDTQLVLASFATFALPA